MISAQCRHDAYEEGCRFCDRIKEARRVTAEKKKPVAPPDDGIFCVHRTPEPIGETQCYCNSGKRMIPAYGCTKLGKCTISARFLSMESGVQCCRTCTKRSAVLDPIKELVWSYGVTTVPERRLTLLPPTLASLAKAGFPDPHLFVDGGSLRDWVDCKYSVTVRGERRKAYGNWWLSLQELYVANPTADRYALFQDDVEFTRNLRTYLESTPWPGPGYLNLYTFPENEKLKRAAPGFFTSNQQGLGALALVFNQESIRVILKAEHMIEKHVPKKSIERRAFEAIDGGVVSAIKQANMKEWVHLPSLVQHAGQHASTMGHFNPLAPSFKGQEFSALELIK